MAPFAADKPPMAPFAADKPPIVPSPKIPDDPIFGLPSLEFEFLMPDLP